jgi:hypothetical protein
MFDTNNNQQSQTIEQEEPEVKKGLWTIDSAPRDGQVKAGEVDREQEEFLKHTEWAK